MTYTKSTPTRPKNRAAKRALAATLAAALTVGSIAAASAASANEATGDWSVSTETLNTGVANGYQLAYADGNVYVADAQWRAERRIVGTPENTPLESGSSMRTSFSPYGIAVDADVDGEAVVVTTTARQRDAATGFGGGVVIYKASQGAPTDADRVFQYADGSPIFSGPRRVAVNAEKNLAYVTSLGDSRGASERQGYITVLDLTKRGAEAVVAQVTVPDAAGAVGVAVDEVNNLIYVGGYAQNGIEKLYVIDGSKIDASAPTDFKLNNGAIRALDAVVGSNARPTYNAELKKVYVSAYDASTITVVEADPASSDYGKALKVIDVRTGADSNNKGTNAVEVDAARGLLYSANLDSGVSVYDINNDYEQIEFTAADGSKFKDVPTSGRSVNFGLDAETGEIWVSTWSSAGTVDIVRVTAPGVEEPTEPNEPGEVAEPEISVVGQLIPGGAITVRGAGFEAGTTARVELHSDPSVLGTVIVSAEGTFEQAANIPSDLAPGEHTVYVFVNDEAVAEYGILVADPSEPAEPTEPGQTGGSDTPAQVVTDGEGTMPNTGGDIVNSTVIIAIALMLALGAGMVVLRRFQNREEAND